MPWLTIRYTPGFQEDLTSWALSIFEDGRVSQEVDMCRFSPRERLKETYRLLLPPVQVAQLRKLLLSLDFDEIKKEESNCVVDDAEQVQVTYNSNGKLVEFTLPLEYLLWRQSRGEKLPTSIQGAAVLWQHIQPVSQYKARDGSDA